MREHITTTEVYGKLIIEGVTEIENIKCIYTDDFYSNKNMEGRFEAEGFSTDVLNNASGSKFSFLDNDGRFLEGHINGFDMGMNFNTPKDYLIFSLDNLTQRLVLKEEECSLLKISFKTPYISLLSRDLKHSWGFDPGYIIKFSSKPFKIIVGDYEIVFEEVITLLKYEKPDSILYRVIYPKIETKISHIDELESIIDKIEVVFNYFMVLLSFLLYQRVNYFGYEISVFNSKGELLETVNHKFSNPTIGSDYIEGRSHLVIKFKKHFTEDVISDLTNHFIQKDVETNGRLKKNLFPVYYYK